MQQKLGSFVNGNGNQPQFVSQNMKGHLQHGFTGEKGEFSKQIVFWIKILNYLMSRVEMVVLLSD